MRFFLCTGKGWASRRELLMPQEQRLALLQFIKSLVRWNIVQWNKFINQRHVYLIVLNEFYDVKKKCVMVSMVMTHNLKIQKMTDTKKLLQNWTSILRGSGCTIPFNRQLLYRIMAGSDMGWLVDVKADSVVVQKGWLTNNWKASW